MSANIPKVFISYSWDDETHKGWVKELATRLRTDGVKTILDQWHTAPGDQLPKFMEKEIRENDYVLIICTPRYKEKSDNREGGVGYEGDIITSEVLTQRNHRKFIPILREGMWKNSSPSWLTGKYYIKLTGNPYSQNSYEELLKTLHDRREKAPPIGKSRTIFSHDPKPEYLRKKSDALLYDRKPAEGLEAHTDTIEIENPKISSDEVDKIIRERVKPISKELINDFFLTPIIHDWPHVRGPNMNGFTDLSDGKGDYMVVIASGDSCVYSFDLNGNQIWSTKLHGGFERLKSYSPAVIDNRIYITTKDGFIHVLDIKGDLKLSKELGVSHAPTSPVIKKDILAIGSFDNACLYDLEGNLFWERSSKGSWDIPPVILDDLILFVSGTTGKRLTALDFEGNEKWTYDEMSGLYAFCPVVDRETIYYSTAHEGLIAFDFNGKKKWTYKIKGTVLSAPAIQGERIVINYAGDRKYDGDGKNSGVVCIDKNGNMKWKDTIQSSLEPGHSTEQPVILDNLVFVPSNHSMLGYYLYNGKRLWSFNVGGGRVSPAAVINHFAVFNNDGATTTAINPDELSLLSTNPLEFLLERTFSKSSKKPKELWIFNQYSRSDIPYQYHSYPVIVRK